MTEKDKEIREVIKEETPHNEVALYMYNRSKKTISADPYETYELLMDLITIGDSLVEDELLKEEIKKFFENEENYPKISNLSFGKDTYSIGNSKAAIIWVRPEELEQGMKHLLRQQCIMIMPRLRLLDSKILSHLVKNGIIKSDEPEELFLKELEAKLDGTNS